MRAIKSVDTKPEMAVRTLTHSLGFRYRLHVRSLPGTPDLVFRSRRKVIFVHGCFWHRHTCGRGRSLPQTRRSFWDKKLSANSRRDLKQRRQLRRMGWGVLIIWECQVRKSALPRLASRIRHFLQNSVDKP